jgi:hypothetical protein
LTKKTTGRDLSVVKNLTAFVLAAVLAYAFSFALDLLLRALMRVYPSTAWRVGAGGAAHSLCEDVWRHLERLLCGAWLDRHGEFASGARELLSAAAERMGVSARGYHTVLRVARNTADPDGERVIESRHVAEAVRYRPAENVLPVNPGLFLARTWSGG